jgi:cobalamin-dependent methionine synthase I
MIKLLPKKNSSYLKSVNSKTILKYIDQDNLLVKWGGNDDYEFIFTPEERFEAEKVKIDMSNNNKEEQDDLNSMHKKVSY